MPDPAIVNVAIPVAIFTAVTVNTRLFAGVTPPMADPKIVTVSLTAYPVPGSTNVAK